MLTSSVLPLSINFNPLLISYSLFLRALTELARPEPTVGTTQKVHLESSKIISHCLSRKNKLIQKLYQIHTKALSHALYHIQLSAGDPSVKEDVSAENMPIKVVEFIKKWVAKEKVLINQLVQSSELLEPDPELELDLEEAGYSFEEQNASAMKGSIYISTSN